MNVEQRAKKSVVGIAHLWPYQLGDDARCGGAGKDGENDKKKRSTKKKKKKVKKGAKEDEVEGSVEGLVDEVARVSVLYE